MSAHTKQNLNHQPYNPWSSYVVEASAGSGKTWQLSRRFLALVIAGADPASILTVTFTKKAAAEMRERIIKDALLLGSGDSSFKDFWSQIKLWQDEYGTGFSRTPQEAAEAILEKTQTLKIMTIDALFLQWCRRHPLETSVEINGNILESPWNLMSSLENRKLYQKAWSKVLSSAESDEQNKSMMRSLITNAPNSKLRSLLSSITPLIESETFSWYIKFISSSLGLKNFTLPHSPLEPSEFIGHNEALFTRVVNLASNSDKRSLAIQAIRERDFSALVTIGIVNSGHDTLNGNTFAKAKKSDDPDFNALNEKLASWSDLQKIHDLNRTGELLWALFEARTNVAHQLKVAERIGSFVDAVKGVSLLACNEDYVGARAIAWSGIKHLMLDEFQDTSRLQWLIFENLAKELLAGGSLMTESGPPSSVFIVGDKKQSIYRFREADPEVLDIAKNSLEPLGLKSFRMSESYRSSRLILDYVNQVFLDGGQIKDFPPHKSATGQAYGSLSLYKRAPTNDLNIQPSEVSTSAVSPTRESFVEWEAKVIASHVKQCLEGIIDIKIPLGKNEGWRAPLPRDFLVLYPNSTHSHVYEDALRQAGVPCLRSERKGYFGRPEIKDLTALMRWLAWPADSVALCTVLKSPICDLSDQTLQDVIADDPALIFDNLKNKSVSTWTFLNDLLTSRYDDSVAVLTGRILADQALADRYMVSFGPIEGPMAKANILKWFDEMRSISTSENGTIDQVIQWLDEKTEEDETGNASLAHDSVTLMTIHKSKGLEFPCVILAGSAHDWHRDDHGWIKDTRQGQEGFWYIGSAAKRPKGSAEINNLLAYNEQESRNEKARLLYVALTRASHHLVITGEESDDPNCFWPLLAGSASQITLCKRLISELPDGSQRTLITSETVVKLDMQKESPRPPPAHIIQTAQTRSNYPALKILSPSGRLKSDDSGIERLQIPIEEARRISKEDSQAYGIIVHKLLELKLSKQTWSTARLVSFLRQNASRNLTDDEASSLLSLAEGEITRLFAHSSWASLTHDADEFLCEVPLAGVHEDYLVNAVADLMILTKDGSCRIVDFKTSQIREEQASQFCKSQGYFEQVQEYCKIVRKYWPEKVVSGYVLFVNPVLLVNCPS